MGRQQFLQFAQKLAGIKKFPDPSSGQAGPICFGDRCRQLIAQLVDANAQRTVQDRGEGFVGLERPAQHQRPVAVAATPAGLPGALSEIDLITVLNPHHLPNESECVHQSYQSGGVEAADPIENRQVVVEHRGKDYAALL